MNEHTLRRLAKPLPNAPELQELDRLTRLALLECVSWQEVEKAFEAVLNHPRNTFTHESLAYRQNYVHFHSNEMTEYKNPYTKRIKKRAEENRIRQQLWMDYLGIKDQPRRSVPLGRDGHNVKGKNGMYKTWGPWALEAYEHCVTGETMYELFHEAMDYSIDLNAITHVCNILFWVVQMSYKNDDLYGESVARDLSEAFGAILRYSKIDMKYCTTSFDMKKIAKKYYDAMN